jgi:hypothetical protein
MPFVPTVEGEAPIQAPAEEFLPAFEKRVVDGLFRPGNRKRADYVITMSAADELRFRAVGWATAASIGLNEVQLRAGEGRIRYRVAYRRWALFVLLLGAAIGLLLIATFLSFDLREYVATHPASRIPGFSTDANVAFAWGCAIFFGFVWPWLVIALHRPHLAKAVRTLIAEVDRVALVRRELSSAAWPPR